MKVALEPGWWLDAEDRPWRFDGDLWHSPCAGGHPIALDDPLLDSSMPLPLRPMVVFEDEPMYARRPAEEPAKPTEKRSHAKTAAPAGPLLMVARPGGREIALSVAAVRVLGSKDVALQVDDAQRAVRFDPSPFRPPATIRLQPLAGGGAVLPAPGLAARLRLAAFDQVRLTAVDGRLLGRAG